MSRTKRVNKTELNAFFLPSGFSVEGTGEEGNKWFNRFEKDKYKALYHLGFLKREEWFSPSVEFLHIISDKLITELSRYHGIEFERDRVQVILSEEENESLLEEVPFALGSEHVTGEWIRILWNNLLEVFRAEIKGFDGKVSLYFAQKNSNIHLAGRIFFHLVENEEEEYPFAFMATYSKKKPRGKKTLHTPLQNALKEFKNDDKKLIGLIASVVKTADQSPFIANLMESGELFSPIRLTVDEAYTFMKEIPLYEEAGIMCRVPNWWRKKTNSLKVSISVGDDKPSRVGLDAMLSFKPQLAFGDEQISEEQLREFLEMSEGLVKYKGKWVEVNRKKLTDALNAFESVRRKSGKNSLTLAEAMRLELNGERDLGLDDTDTEIEISNGEWFRKIRNSLTKPGQIKESDPVASFKATLRGYQTIGYNWLQNMSRFGFGACLGDDMGLGKTVQVIAMLEYIRTTRSGNALLILPASLMGNWQKEIEKFAPELTYKVLHKSAMKSGEEITIDENIFLHMTTYGMARRLEALRERTWDILILDEAQAIKNPGSQQTKSIKNIPAAMKIGMTGTPVENHLSDLWSLFDFLNPGLLGNRTEFSKFAKGLNADLRGYAKLRKMIQPFLLRRLKTDKSIISDLPEKIEVNEYAAMSKKQIALYKKLVKDIASKIEKAGGIERKGLVLSSIVKFKQICNHPDHYLGKEDFKTSASGKFEQLGEICRTIAEKRERILIFTQFREMTDPLSAFLTEIFEKEGFVLHGGTSVKKRTEMVEAFNSEKYIPYMVLSLKAGGTGLNLTAANHVVHFDRWWNPAVENQATDRAFRIGQKKNVIVHKFITRGTIEEKIDAMINDKKKLAEDVLSTGSEKWITEFNNDELMGMFRLGGV